VLPSIITWALVPLIPKEETPPRGGPARPPATAGRRSAAAPPPRPSPRGGDGASTCKVAGSSSCRSACTILITPATPAARLGMADVRLHRPQPQAGPASPAVLPVGRHDRLGLDRVAEPGAGPVCFHRVDVGGGESRRGQRRPDHPLLRRPAWGRSARLLAPSEFTALPRSTARTWWPWRWASASRSSASSPAPSAQLVPSARRRERLAPSVGRQPALPGELHEHPRGHHDGDAARERERAFARAQRLGGQVQARPATPSMRCPPTPPGPQARARRRYGRRPRWSWSRSAGSPRRWPWPGAAAARRTGR